MCIRQIRCSFTQCVFIEYRSGSSSPCAFGKSKLWQCCWDSSYVMYHFHAWPEIMCLLEFIKILFLKFYFQIWLLPFQIQPSSTQVCKRLAILEGWHHFMMDSWRPNPRAQPFVPRRQHSPFNIHGTYQRVTTRRIISKFFQVSASWLHWSVFPKAD